MNNETQQDRKDFPCYCINILKHKINCTPCTCPPTCFRGELLEADASPFHTNQLVEATQAINKILSGLQPEVESQSLAFIQTRMGTMLTWVTPPSESVSKSIEDETVVTMEDDDETIAKALRLKNYKSKSPGTE